MFKKIARNMKLFCMQIEEAGLRFQNMYLVCAADLRRAFAFRIWVKLYSISKRWH